MEWIRDEENFNVPVKSWCKEIEDGAMAQAADLAKHPVVFRHVALMPDCHQGYGMPIGGVIACTNAVIPNAVGVDIGCGMGAVRTSIIASETTRSQLRDVVIGIKEKVPCGEGKAHKKAQNQDGFDEAIDSYNDRKWFSEHVRDLACRNLGTLGGGNHFIEIQAGDDSHVWLMIHSGSRHLGNVIARYYNSRALELNRKWHSNIPNKDLAFLPVNTQEGQDYIKDMNFALDYAKENRRIIMDNFMAAFQAVHEEAEFGIPVNIHHNYAALESHFGKDVWVHRKGATSAKQEETGIIPGSMGTSSYIVKGLGNIESFMSCSHGAGRVMGRMQATRTLTPEECDKAMDGIVYDRWGKVKRGKTKGMYDLSEAPQAYKNIDEVIEAEQDLIQPIVKLKPLGVVKG
ncbi:RNA-2',3'-PO4:RNA-5'-OH ligase [Olavius sp. associated proteobacterium Delta 1]|nr:RNA-2',3'-PO4:RNA-5'-OH ligase [Olavius sp. associated proteobacterium Delta 1]